MMSSMNPSIDASMTVISTAKGSAVSILIFDCCLSSCGSKDRCGEFRSYASQNSSWSRSFTRSISASLTVVYSAGARVMTQGNRRQIKASSSTIGMHV